MEKALGKDRLNLDTSITDRMNKTKTNLIGVLRKNIWF